MIALMASVVNDQNCVHLKWHGQSFDLIRINPPADDVHDRPLGLPALDVADGFCSISDATLVN